MVRRGAACAADERRVTAWECNGCGACCRALATGLLSDPEAARALDSGDGVCRHLERSTNRCTIYETRPACCRVTPAHAPEALTEGCRVLRLAIYREV